MEIVTRVQILKVCKNLRYLALNAANCNTLLSCILSKYHLITLAMWSFYCFARVNIHWNRTTIVFFVSICNNSRHVSHSCKDISVCYKKTMIEPFRMTLKLNSVNTNKTTIEMKRRNLIGFPNARGFLLV